MDFEDWVKSEKKLEETWLLESSPLPPDWNKNKKTFMCKFEIVYSSWRAVDTLYQVWNVLLTTALKTSRSPTVDGPRNLNISTDFRRGCTRQRRLVKQGKKGGREESNYPPKYFHELLIHWTDAIDKYSICFLSKHLFQLKSEIYHWIGVLRVVLYTLCKYFGKFHVPKS